MTVQTEGLEEMVLFSSLEGLSSREVDLPTEPNRTYQGE
jgi:hypothetical protein